MKFETYSSNETKEIARQLAESAKPGDIYCLTGDLGVGKTVFAKGFAEGLGIKSDITSPTFTIMNEYHTGRIPLYHFDVYRLKYLNELDDTGYDDYFYGEGCCLIEWADIIRDLLPEGTKEVIIEKDYFKDENYRLVRVGAYKK